MPIFSTYSGGWSEYSASIDGTQPTILYGCLRSFVTDCASWAVCSLQPTNRIRRCNAAAMGVHASSASNPMRHKSTVPIVQTAAVSRKMRLTIGCVFSSKLNARFARDHPSTLVTTAA